MAIIVLFTLGTLPRHLFARETHKESALAAHREPIMHGIRRSRSLARSSTTKATFIVRLCAFSTTQHYKILGVARERQAHSLHYRSLSHIHNTEKTLLMNGKRHGETPARGEEFIC
jgi:hypothetical protein